MTVYDDSNGWRIKADEIQTKTYSDFVRCEVCLGVKKGQRAYVVCVDRDRIAVCQKCCGDSVNKANKIAKTLASVRRL